MRLSIVLFSLLAPAAFASTLTEPIPTVTTTCTVNQSPVQCGGFLAPGANAYGDVSGLNTAEGVSINLTAEVWTNSQIQQASALASLDFLGATDGPQRSGYATYSIYTDGDHGGDAGIFATGMIEGLASNPLIGTQGVVVHGSNAPFQLGVPFEVQASVLANSFFAYSGAGGVTQIQLQLFELDGTPVTIFDPPATAIPEPASWALVAAGLGIVGGFSTINSRTKGLV